MLKRMVLTHTPTYLYRKLLKRVAEAKVGLVSLVNADSIFTHLVHMLHMYLLPC